MERKKDYKDTLEEIRKFLIEEHHLNICWIFLQGSQNYGMDKNDEEYQSDIDVKAFYYPSKYELVFGEKGKTTDYVTKYGKASVSDVRFIFELLSNGNPLNYELLYTEYYLADNIYETIREKRDLILKENFSKFGDACYGIMNSGIIKYKKTKSSKELAKAFRSKYMMTYIYEGYELLGLFKFALIKDGKIVDDGKKALEEARGIKFGKIEIDADILLKEAKAFKSSHKFISSDTHYLEELRHSFSDGLINIYKV
ncbi:MAG: hypothetical protein MJ252_00110 [archaeon]|nr:hypothetical protein [archaeon]